jgi:hypothetical protein
MVFFIISCRIVIPLLNSNRISIKWIAEAVQNYSSDVSAREFDK